MIRSWAGILVWIAASAYVTTAVAFHLATVLLQRRMGRRISLSLGRLAVLLSICTFSGACVLLVRGDALNASDFSIVGYYLLTGGVVGMSVNYLRGYARDRARGTQRDATVAEHGHSPPKHDGALESSIPWVAARDAGGVGRGLRGRSDSAEVLLQRRRAHVSSIVSHAGRIPKRRHEGFSRALHVAVQKYLIFVIAAAALCIRLYHIDAPILGVQSWRQADTAAIARNFYEGGLDLFYPQVDWGGHTAGYVESELPIYPFMVALLYKAFGYGEAWGRGLSALFWAIAVYGLYALARKHVSLKCALWSCLLLSTLPVSLYYSRAFMPESTIVMCSILGVYFFSEWLSTERSRFFWLSASFVALACLTKIPTLYLGVPLLYLAWSRYGRRTFLQARLWFFAFIVLLPLGLWHYHAHQLFLNTGLTFGIWQYGIDKWGNWDLLLTARFWKKLMLTSLCGGHLAWAGVPLLLVGLLQRRRQKREALFDFWAIGVFLYFLIVTRGNYVHEYYQLPFMVPACVFMGKALARHIRRGSMRKKGSVLLALCLATLVVLGVMKYRTYMRYENPNCVVMDYALDVQRRVDRNSLVVAVDNGDPTVLYLAHRKGWHAWTDRLEETFGRRDVMAGAKYVIGGKYLFKGDGQKKKLGELLDQHEILHQTDGYFILKMAPDG